MARGSLSCVSLVLLLFSIGSVYHIAYGNLFAGLPFKPVVVNPPQLLDINGNRIDSVEVGQQVRVRVVFLNNVDVSHRFLGIVEIRNGDGVTEYISWQSGRLDVTSDSWGSYTYETTWIPTNGECVRTTDGSQCSSNYQIRAFAITDLENPQVLSDLGSMDSITVVERTEQGNKLYRFMMDGKQYEIEYSLSTGYIDTITAQPLDFAMIINLNGITADTNFTISLPSELIDKIPLRGVWQAPTGEEETVHYYPADIYVGLSLAHNVQIVEESKDKTTWIIPIPKGSAEVSFFVTQLF